MAQRLLGKDCSITIYDGGPYPGPPAWGAAAIVTAYARRIMVKVTADKEDVTGLGDTNKRRRPTYADGSVEIELLVLADGALDIPIGDFIRVDYKANGTFAYPETIIGFLEGSEIESPQGPTTQKLTIDPFPDYP